MRWFDFFGRGGDPWEYLSYLILSSVVLGLMRGHPVALVLIVAGFFVWPKVFRFYRGLWRELRGGLRKEGVARVPGCDYCPDCGVALEGGSKNHRFPHRVCSECLGAWCRASDLDGSKNGGARPGAGPWEPLAAKSDAPPPKCPSCNQPTESGAFSAGAYRAYRCGSCAGYWFPQDDWVKLGLGL